MSIVCAICEKKQIGFITAFALSQENNEKRICSRCNENKMCLLKSATLEYDDYIKSRDYFTNFFTEKSLSDDVKKYIESIIDFSDNEIKVKNDIADKAKEEIEQEKEKERILKANIENFLMTTGYDFEKYSIERYNKVICADTVLGTGFMSEFSASMADVFGGQSQMFADKLEQARGITTNKLIIKAIELESNAIIGIDFDYVIFGSNMIGVIASGTAVTVEII